MCGGISQYNRDSGKKEGPSNIFNVIAQRIK
jgi:NADPH-dependent curcumin reductase CurA